MYMMYDVQDVLCKCKMNEGTQTKIVKVLLGVYQLDSDIALCLITVDGPICSQVNNDSSSYHGVGIVCLKTMLDRHIILSLFLSHTHYYSIFFF